MAFFYLTGCLAVELNWTTASEQCRKRNDTLVVLEDLVGHFSISHSSSGVLSWSAERVHTPWIAYRGICYIVSSIVKGDPSGMVIIFLKHHFLWVFFIVKEH